MSAYSDKVIADGAVAYWRLGETSGSTAVDIVGGNNGTISGGVTLNQPGATTDGNPAMRFDGVNGKIVTAATISIPVSCTWECWIKTTAAANNAAIVSNRFTVQDGIVGLFFLGGNVFVDSYQAGNNAVSSTGTLVNDGKWHHIIWVTNGSTGAIYLDGAQTVSQAQPHVTLTEKVQIGFDTFNAVYWNGLIDDVAIYPTALTPTQIAAHYAAGTNTLTSPFIFLDEDDGMLKYNVWTPVTPSDSADLPRLTDGIWVGTGGNVAAVMQNNTVPTTLAVPSGAWLPIVARRINATNTTASGIVALNAV